MTNEELDALGEMARDLCHTGELSMPYRCEISDTITTLRAQLAEARADIAKMGRALNVARYGQPDFSWELHKMAMQEAVDQRDRAEAALAAQIEADAGIADYYVKMRECQIADEKAKAAHHINVSQLMRWGAGKVQSAVIATAIRAQPHDRTALDAMLRAEREKALREAADLVARYTDKITAEDIANAILAMISREDWTKEDE